MSSPSISQREPASCEVTGIEWVIDAIGCAPSKLCDRELIRDVCNQVVTDLGLNVVGEPQCHQFPDPGGVTALYLLSESHLACHTYPEHSLATFNLYCCREREGWGWAEKLRDQLGANEVRVQQITRGGRGET